jgi:allantoicase
MELFDGFVASSKEKPSDQYFTPKWLFDALGAHFDLDVASPEGGSNVPCDRYFTAAINGLAQPWEGLVWCNPPYSESGKWVDKFIKHNNGILLVPFSKSKWLNRLFDCPGIMAVPPVAEMLFEHYGKEASIYMPVFLFALGDGIPYVQNSGIGQTWVQGKLPLS